MITVKEYLNVCLCLINHALSQDDHLNGMYYNKFLTRVLGAIYRYYESRCQKVNDSRSDHRQQLEKNIMTTEKDQISKMYVGRL